MPDNLPPGIFADCSCSVCFPYHAAQEDTDTDTDDLIDSSDLELAELWSEFQPSVWSPSTRQREFRQYLRGLVSDPDAIDNDLSFCGNCNYPAWNDDLNSAQGGDVYICESCWDDYSSCEICGEKYPNSDLYTTLSESEICDSCRDNYYSYCEECEGYYHDDDGHNHGGDGCCESPQLNFTIRNDGDAPLANDTRVTVTLPDGIISEDGLRTIRDYLRNSGHFDLAYDLPQLGDQWQTRDGNYPKRLSRHAYKIHRIKLTQDVMSQIGVIAREHSTAVDVRIEISRDLNQSSYYWYNEGSCWWGGYSESRCAAKTNGVFGLRSFSEHDVSGRAWVIPLKQIIKGYNYANGELRKREHTLVPTFNTMTPSAFAVFNGYGDLSGYAAARILAHMTGWTYRKVSFNCKPMYVNSEAYIVAPEDIAKPYTDGSLYLSGIRQHSNLFFTEQSERERESINV